MLGANPLYVATQLGHVSRTEVAAANEFPRFGWNDETLHYEWPRSASANEKASLSLAFFFVPIPQIPRNPGLESKPQILVGGASFELATPAV